MVSGHIVFKLTYRALLVMIRKAVNELYAASGLDYPAAIGKSPRNGFSSMDIHVLSD
jgi:hypothetical protein